MKQRYLALPDSLYQVIKPSKVKDPNLLLFNQALALELDLPQQLLGKDAAEYFSGNQLISPELSLALGYSGHQFGSYNPQLGDGRAHMLGQINGYDWQLKGSGLTKYSRSGDGRCALGPAVREYIMSEAMHILGVPAMRTLAVTSTGETVYRHQPEVGAVVSRIGRSHLRIGSFQYASALGVIKELADFAIDQLCPEGINADNPYLRLYRTVQHNQINTLVHWYRIGFIHGVVNTDNIALSGETFDFGPCAMLGEYKLEQVYSSIDQQGRYAFGHQKWIMQWNLARFAETLIPLISENEQEAITLLTQELDNFSNAFQQAYDQMCAHKLGFDQNEHPLISEFFELLRTHAWDYTQIFNQLYHWINGGNPQLPGELLDWSEQWQHAINHKQALMLMSATNPKAIPRNHEVEMLIEAAENGQQGIQQKIDNYLNHLKGNVYTGTSWGNPDSEFDHQYQTFCGT
ncbi:MAG: Protein adenylyltransferase SelO [Candidatus Celerinatantimonas neptuna]|nr:MAG: Protein adenylyltransferase SelO [Candidatus Celerinatantimonas neptuna]